MTAELQLADSDCLTTLAVELAVQSEWVSIKEALMGDWFGAQLQGWAELNKPLESIGIRTLNGVIKLQLQSVNQTGIMSPCLK